jgi:hypothetical protein
MKPFSDFIRKNFKKLMWSDSPIAGLEIKDAAIRIAQFDGDIIKKSAVLLEPGVIEFGKVKDRERLTESFKKLHSQFSSNKEKIPVIAIIPSANIYAQVFSVPALSGEELKDAAELSLASISPIDLSTAYADWQQLSIVQRDNRIEMLGAFAVSSVVDEYVAVLEEAGFTPIAIEFPALAISRAIRDFSAGIDIKKPQVVLNVSSDGIDFVALRHGNLYFDYFIPWKVVQEEGKAGREILFSDFKETIVKEIKKVAAFYGSHWEGKLDKIILISQALNEEISGFIKENFPFEVVELKLGQFRDLPTSWFGVLGSAIRGKIPRAEDNLISLMKIGTEEEYFRNRIKLSIKSWGNILLTVMVFLVLIFVLADSFLYRMSDRVASQVLGVGGGVESAEISELQEQARRFNQLVGKISAAKKRSAPQSQFFSRLSSLSQRRVVLERILVNRETGLVLLSGQANDEATALDFKNALVREGFADVSLPLSNIVSNQNQTVSFSLTFRL